MPDEKPKPAMQTREMRIELEPGDTRADGTADERIKIALSSETPVERYDWYTGERYFEVLDHSPGGVDLSYARDGMPFLLDHNARTQIGIIEDVRLDTDRKLRGYVRMGNHPDAAWVEKDIRAGIRTKISVGYDPGERYSVSGGETPTRTYRGWQPREGSSVAIPADLAVGVGRSAAPAAPAPVSTPAVGEQPKERSMPEPIEPQPGASAAEQREKDLKKLASYAQDFAEARELLPSWLARGVSPEQALEEVAKRQKETAKPAPVVAGHLDMPEKERKAYSINRAIMAAAAASQGARGAWNEAGLEAEVSAAIAKRGGKDPAGFFVPMDLPIDLNAAARFNPALRKLDPMLSRASVTGNIAATTSLGGAGVQTTIIGFIDLLRARTVTAGLGATFLTGLTDTVQFTRQITANTFNWVGENPSTANALTSNTLDTVTLTPKVGMSSTAFSRRLLAQFSFDVNAFVMNDLSRVNAIGIDTAALFGTGAANQPTGIRSQTGVTLQTVAANGAAAAWADLVLAETNVANANADIGSMGWVVSPKVRGKWKGTLKSTTAGSLYLWSENGEVNGYPSAVTTIVPDNTTQGTSTTICSTPIFGVWSELLIGEWGGAMDVVVDPYTYAQQNMIQVVTSLMVDVNIKHPAAFNVMLGVLTT